MKTSATNIVVGTAAVVGHKVRGAACASAWPGVPEEYGEVRWYAVYTSANHEKSVAKQLVARDVEHFLPTYDSSRRWKDRRVVLQMPLFSGYVFVRLALRDRLMVLEVPGVARLVGFNGVPTPLPDAEIEALKASLEDGVRAEPYPYLTTGRRVRVKSGPLTGMKGILIRKKNGTRLVISVELILRSVAVEVDGIELQPEW